MNLSLKSHIKLNPLVIRQDKKNYIVEESLSGDFFEMPEVCVAALERIKKGEPLAETENRLKSDYPEEDVNLTAFIAQLYELGFISEVDGISVQGMKKKQSPKGFTWISAGTGKFFFNRVTSKLYLFFICLNILLIFQNPHLLPRYQDLFVFEAMTLNVLVFAGISLFLILVHEMGHILAVRSYNLPARVEVGRRLFFVVFETDLTPAWKLPPYKRNILYLAGIYVDQLVMLIAFTTLLLFPGISPLLTAVLGLVILDLFMKTVYQCCFYMKTDLYYLCENISGCYNLMENGRNYLHQILPFVKKEAETEVFEGEAGIIRLYSLFYLTGVLLTSGLFAFYFIPQVIYAFTTVVPDLFSPGEKAYFWDAVVFLSQFLVMFFLLGYSWQKNRNQEKQRDVS